MSLSMMYRQGSGTARRFGASFNAAIRRRGVFVEYSTQSACLGSAALASMFTCCSAVAWKMQLMCLVRTTEQVTVVASECNYV